MPKLIIPPQTLEKKENELIPKIISFNSKLIKKHEEQASVYIIGKADEGFWKEEVLSKPRDIILDPFDDFPIMLKENLTHFAFFTLENKPDTEFYYGNQSMELAAFAKSILLKAIEKYEHYLEDRLSA